MVPHLCPLREGREGRTERPTSGRSWHRATPASSRSGPPANARADRRTRPLPRRSGDEPHPMPLFPCRNRLVSAWIFEAEKTADFCGSQMPFCRRGFCIGAESGGNTLRRACPNRTVQPTTSGSAWLGGVLPNSLRAPSHRVAAAKANGLIVTGAKPRAVEHYLLAATRAARIQAMCEPARKP